MMGQLYIDGKDIYINYGISMIKGTYDGLLEFSQLKPFTKIDWLEEDGIQVDLLEPALDTRELEIQFVGKNLTGAFLSLLSDKAYHIFVFGELGRTYKLRLVSQTKLDVWDKMEIFALRFANDFPLPENYSYLAPDSDIFTAQGYKLDGIDLREYGIAILQGTRAEILKSPAVKKNLLQNYARQNGAIYDNEIVVFQSKEVKLNCYMTAKNLAEFWRNYDALLYNLSRPNERKLYVDYTGREYPCYYKSLAVNNFFPTGKIWFTFVLTLVFTSYRYADIRGLRKVNNVSLRLVSGDNFRFFNLI